MSEKRTMHVCYQRLKKWRVFKVKFFVFSLINVLNATPKIFVAYSLGARNLKRTGFIMYISERKL